MIVSDEEIIVRSRGVVKRFLDSYKSGLAPEQQKERLAMFIGMELRDMAHKATTFGLNRDNFNKKRKKVNL